MNYVFRKIILLIVLISFSSNGYSGLLANSASIYGGYKLIKFTAKHPKKAILGSVTVLTAAGITWVKYKNMVENPEESEDFIINLIESEKIKDIALLGAIKLMSNYQLENSESEYFKNDVHNFLDYYHIDNEDPINTKIINSPEYLTYIKEVSDIMKEEIEKNNKKYDYCNLTYYNSMANSPSFNVLDGILLTKIGFQPTNIYAVNNYKILTINKHKEITPDHIPSYKSIEIFLKNKGVILSDNRNKNKILTNNTTTINVLSKNHKKGSRTFGGRNKKKKYNKDSENLITASILDSAYFATYLTLFTNEDVETYLKSISVLFGRNSEMCLYYNN